MPCRIILSAAVALMSCSSVYSQQQTPQRTPWHRSVVFTYTHQNPPGHTSGMGEMVANVPSGYTGVIEHISARCVVPPILSIVYGDIVVSANPANAGQSGKPGPAGQEDAANHPVLFQTAFSGSPNVYVASQKATLRVNAPSSRITFNGFFVSQSSESPVATCLVSISGYMEKQ
jgi:hypothetical protein